MGCNVKCNCKSYHHCVFHSFKHKYQCKEILPSFTFSWNSNKICNKEYRYIDDDNYSIDTHYCNVKYHKKLWWYIHMILSSWMRGNFMVMLIFTNIIVI